MQARDNQQTKATTGHQPVQIIKKRPRTPTKSTTASSWKRYYERMAEWFQAHADTLKEYPGAEKYATEEANRYNEGAQMLRAGTHPNQISGDWK